MKEEDAVKEGNEEKREREVDEDEISDFFSCDPGERELDEDDRSSTFSSCDAGERNLDEDDRSSTFSSCDAGERELDEDIFLTFFPCDSGERQVERDDKPSLFFSCDSDSSNEEQDSEGTSALRTDTGDTELSPAAALEPKAGGPLEPVSKPLATVRTQSLPRELELTPAERSGLPEGLKTNTHTQHTGAQHTHTQPACMLTEPESSLAEGSQESEDAEAAVETACLTSGSGDQQGSSKTVGSTPFPAPLLTIALPGPPGDPALQAQPREEAHSAGSQPPEPPASEPEAPGGPSHRHTLAQREALVQQGMPTSHTDIQSSDIHQAAQESIKGFPTGGALAAGKAWGLGRGRPRPGVLHACLEQAQQLEEWLERAQGSLQGAHSSMQDSVEKQLLSCQEMFKEIEQKVSSLSSLGDLETPMETQQEAEALSSKLEVLKKNLVTFQNILQEQDKGLDNFLPQASAQTEHALEDQMKHNSSVQEMLSSCKSTLIRQNSLQQQRELEQDLSEQRDLTKALVRQGSRTRLHSLATEEHTHTTARPSADAIRQEEEVACQRKWTHLLGRLSDGAPELTPDHEHAETITSVCVWNTTTGNQCLQELKEHLTHLRQLAFTAAQASPGEASQRCVDEGVFELLCGLDLSLSSLSTFLILQPSTSQLHTQLQQLQSISAVLSSLGAELGSLGPALSAVLGAGPGSGPMVPGQDYGGSAVAVGSGFGGSAMAAGPSECLVLVQRRVKEAQAALNTSHTQLQERLDKHTQLQWRIKELHASVLTNLSAQQHSPINLQDLQCHLQVVSGPQQQHQGTQLTVLQKEAEQEGLPSSLSQQSMQLEVLLESVWRSLLSHSAGVCEALEKQQLLRRLPHGFRNLLLLARERLTITPLRNTHTPAQLQTYISSHMRLFLSVQCHLRTLQQLSRCMSTGASNSWEAEVQALEQEVDELQQAALERHIHMCRILQMWTQWKQNHTWLENHLLELEKQLPKMHLEQEEPEEEEQQERTSIYVNLQTELLQCYARCHIITEHAQRLQQEGVATHNVAMATQRLELRLDALQQKVDHERNIGVMTKKFWNKFHRYSGVLTEWMGGVKERLDTWRGHMTWGKQDPEHALLLLRQFQEFSRELEVQSGLRASVLSSSTQLITLMERQCTHTDLTHHHTHTTDHTHIRDHTHTSDHTHTCDHTHISTATDASALPERNISSGTHTPPKSDKNSIGLAHPPLTHTCASLVPLTHTPTCVSSAPGAPPSALCSLQERLEQLEQNWAHLLNQVPAVQENIQKVLLEGVCPQELLAELLAWLGVTEAGLEQDRLPQTPQTFTHLRSLLNSYKGLQADISAQQFSVDLLNQAVVQMGCSDTHLRYTHIQFAEELGDLNNRWNHLQNTFNTQIQQVEQLVEECAEREVKLHFLQHWVKGQQDWLQLAERPSCRSAAMRRMRECETLEKRVRQRCSDLEEMRKSECDKDSESEQDLDFLAEIDSLTHSCATLAQQCVCVHSSLQQLLVQWASYDAGLEQLTRHTLKTKYNLQLSCSSPLSPHTLQANADRLQLSQNANEEMDQKWEGLDQTLSALVGLIDTNSAHTLTEQFNMERTQWCDVKQRLSADIQRCVSAAEAWRCYVSVSGPCSERLQLYRDQLTALSHTHTSTEHTQQDLTAHIHTTQTIQENIDRLQDDLQEEIEASKVLIRQLDPMSAMVIQSQSRLLSRGVLQLSQVLTAKQKQLQEDLKQQQEFDCLFSALEKHLQGWQGDKRMLDLELTNVPESGLLDLSALSADLDWLNELSYAQPLSESTNQRLQKLNRKWVEASARSLDRCSEMQAACLQQQGFEQCCESWLSFLQRMEDNLAVELPGNYTHLKEQLHTHQRFQSELSLGHQILHSVIQEALHLLERGEVENRSDFLLKLAQLRQHWQGAVQRAAQQRALVVGLVQHWHLYRCGLSKLRKLLPITDMLLPPISPSHCTVAQLRLSLENLKRTEQLLQRCQASYLQTMEVGGQLFSTSDAQTQTQLQTELATLQEHWELTHSMLGRRRSLINDIMKTWENCETQLVDSAQELEDMKARLKQPIPEHLDEMQEAEQFVKEVEESLEQWAVRLGKLSSMRTDLSQYIISDDTLLLQEQVDQLHGQWEELCLKVSLRKQEIADRLNAWIIFNEKNKELCEWLTQMENKVAHSAELSIEDMVEKLKKDCMEEINLFSENKTHLKQLGEQLISASNKTKETEINDKLKDISDRWQHLFDHIEARVRKLKETLVTVQQLDKNMSNLRTWLSRIEAELAKPVVYSVCHSDEIQRKLAEQQDLQRDIEQHTEGVASVLTLCDVLLHDADACGSDLENDSIQQTTRSLDRRWRNICAMSMERRMRIEETWRLWCKFLDDYSRFEDWLKAAERTAANPATVDVLYTCAKEELKKFEAFQRQVHERLTQLELVNKQYRRLARENRTDAASKLKVMVHEGNQRWDELQRRVAAILRRLKHFTSQREEFEGTRESILVWLTEMDLQLTNVEHFSESDIHDKMRQLNAFQQEITLNTNKIDALIVFGETLIQRSAPLDAVLIEDELEELHSYCQEVFGRVARFHQRLTSRRPVLEEELDLSDRDTDLEESGELELGVATWAEEDEGRAGEGQGVVASTPRVCHLLAPPLERSGRETPVSVDSIPLEWDHTVDVGGSSSHEEEEEGTYYSALSDVEVTESSEEFLAATAKALGPRPVGKADATWHSPDPHQRKTHSIRSTGSSPSHTSTPYHTPGYVKLMSECSGSIDSVKRVKLLLSDDELLGLKAVNSAEKQPGVIERWELQQCELHDQQEAQHWQRLQEQLSSLDRWLSATLPELQSLQQLQPNTSLTQMENHIRKLKEMQRSFTSYKALMISINLIGRELLGGRELQGGASDELKELHENLKSTNQKWTQVCAALDCWESRLHKALMQCQEFHETLHSMLLWLAQVEKQRFNINIHKQTLHKGALESHRETLKCVEAELQRRQEEVRPLVALCSELLLEAEGEESMEAREKVHVVSNKLCLLLRQVGQDLHVLQARLDLYTLGSSVDPSDADMTGGDSTQHKHKEVAGESAVGTGPVASVSPQKSSPVSSWSLAGGPFLRRVVRAAFPLHLLCLLLLVLTCLVPLSQEDYSCALANNFARSFYPMLRYTNGPPPT